MSKPKDVRGRLVLPQLPSAPFSHLVVIRTLMLMVLVETQECAHDLAVISVFEADYDCQVDCWVGEEAFFDERGYCSITGRFKDIIIRGESTTSPLRNRLAH